MKFNGTTQKETDKIIEVTGITEDEIAAYNAVEDAVNKDFMSLPLWAQCELIGKMAVKAVKGSGKSMDELLKVISETERGLASVSEGQEYEKHIDEQ